MNDATSQFRDAMRAVGLEPSDVMESYCPTCCAEPCPSVFYTCFEYLAKQGQPIHRDKAILNFGGVEDGV